MKAYEMDDEPTIYAANDDVAAAMLYILDCGEEPQEGYPRELTDEELDRQRPDYDEDERPTGEMTNIRSWLDAATEPGYLCGAIR
ncbi:MAG: hypothetical protein K8L99_32920 [Anaerolineae bacterium]|nr:hypothetical protein [Anaerolineae bacterium]MCL4722754.1 hypothetical protein [Rhodocyclaceae bacterium]